MKKALLIFVTFLGLAAMTFGSNKENISTKPYRGDGDDSAVCSPREMENNLAEEIYQKYNRWNFNDLLENSAETVVFFKIDENKNLIVLGTAGNKRFSQIIINKLKGFRINNCDYDPLTVYNIRFKYTVL